MRVAGSIFGRIRVIRAAHPSPATASELRWTFVAFGEAGEGHLRNGDEGVERPRGDDEQRRPALHRRRPARRCARGRSRRRAL
ncbi:MAG: hypothetical protein MZV63_65720 [Marinilabiliales bacterium]|nr:hypothetical protein [Marinilabiliales bacterium]